jgi:hypothetical protein
VRECLFAFTEPGFNPDYLNVSSEDGVVTVTVRGPKKEHDSGPTASTTIPKEQIPELIAALQKVVSA